jgi:tetratricopeptide (TPR) repeat protein
LISGWRAAVVPLFLPCAFVLCDCASALKPPGPLPGAGGPSPTPEVARSLLERARALDARHHLESVREAAALFLTAARSSPSRIEALEGSARSQIWLAGHEPDPAARESAAAAAVRSAQWCLELAPESGACHYWIGAALGVQAREKRSTALDALPRIEQAFLTAAEKDPSLEEAGPERALALLYLRAPAWPSGPGDPERGLDRARRAAALRPGYPPNHLVLAEALSKAGDAQGAREEYSKAMELARSAAGNPDAPEWIEEAEKALAGVPGGR